MKVCEITIYDVEDNNMNFDDSSLSVKYSVMNRQGKTICPSFRIVIEP